MIRSSLVLALATPLFLLAPSVAAAGAATGAWSDSGIVVTAGPWGQGSPALVADQTGGCFVAWLDTRSSPASFDHEVYLSRIGANGTPAEGWPAGGLQVSLDTGEVLPLLMHSDGAGGVALFWADDYSVGDSVLNRVFMHRFKPDGTRHPAFPVGGRRLPPFEARRVHDVMASGDGGFYLAGSWVGDAGSGSQGGILLTRVDSLGATAIGWQDSGVLLCDEPRTQSGARILPDGSGGVLVIWRDLRSGVDARLYGVRVSAAGVLDSSWPVEGRDLALLDSNENPGFESVPDSAGFIVAIGPQGLLAFDFDGEARAGWPPPLFTRAESPDGPNDLFHRPIASGRGPYLSWIRRRHLGGAIFEDQRMLTLLTTYGTSATHWPDTGMALNRSVGSDTLPPLVIRPSPQGLYLILGATDEQGDNYYRGGLLSPDLTWAPGWPAGGREVSRTIQGGPSVIASDGSLYLAFPYSEPFSTTRGIRLFKMGVDGPVPTLASVASAEVQGDLARIEWHVVDPPASPFRVQRSSDVLAWELAGLPTWSGPDRVRFEEGGVAPGERRAYRLAWSEGGQPRSAGLVWLQRPSTQPLTLESARHLAGVERLDLKVAAESSDPIDVQVLDVQGRTHAKHTLPGGSSTMRTLSMSTATWGPGLYFLRLTQAGAEVRSRVTVLR